jgi:serine/threonine protein phosphatase 1
MISYFEPNSKGRDFVIGDLHGAYKNLMVLMEKLNFSESQDRLFALGDLIDRGNDSEKCLDLLKQPWFFSIKGNHEELLMKTFENSSFRPLWNKNGGQWSENISADTLASYANIVRDLPLVISIRSDVGRINLLHAEFFGSDEDLDRGNYSEKVQQQLLWGRQLISNPKEFRPLSQISKTYCGHSVVKTPIKIGAQIYIDTGAGFISEGGKLTIADLSENRFYTV